MYKVYGKEWCIYCDRAKKLLESKNISYTYFDIVKDDDARHWSLERAGGRRTVPIIFDENDNCIGGFDELREVLKD
jgi:glutaredoxin